MKNEVFDYIESFYNRRRHRSRLDWISTVEFEGRHASPSEKLTR